MDHERDVQILIAEDDDEDFFLTQKAFERGRLKNTIHRVKNGKQLIEYLRNSPPYEDVRENPRPKLIMLDLNMPVMDGRAALEVIKKDPFFNGIPVIVFTTSKAEEDIIRSYSLGVNSFIRKPVEFADFVNVLAKSHEYWFKIVELP